MSQAKVDDNKSSEDKTTTAAAAQKLTPTKQDYKQLEEILDCLVWGGYLGYFGGDKLFDHNNVSAKEFFENALIQHHACFYDIFFHKDNGVDRRSDPYYQVQDPLKIFENDPRTSSLKDGGFTYLY